MSRTKVTKWSDSPYVKIAKMGAKAAMPMVKYQAKQFLRKQMQTKSSPGSSSVQTNQYNYSSVYRKRRGRRRGRRTGKFQRKVKAILYKQVADNQYVRVHSGSILALANQQGFDATGIGFISGSPDYFDDLNKLVGELFDTTGYGKSSKTIIKTMCLDITLNNTSPSNTIDCDVYTLMCKKDVPQKVNGIDNSDDKIGTMWNYLLTQTPALDDGATNLGGGVNGTQFGVTPFQAPMFCKYWTVAEKKKFILSPGQVANIHKKDTRMKTLYSLESNNLFAKRGVSTGYLFVINGVPVSANASTGSIPAVTMAWNAVRTYNMKFLQPAPDTVLKT